jgi:hypothetical protein
MATFHAHLSPKLLIQTLTLAVTLNAGPTLLSAPITATGAATVDDVESDLEVRKARQRAIADGLRQIAISQPTRVSSTSFVANNLQLHESTHLASDFRLAGLEITSETLLGGVYQVRLKAQVTDSNSGQDCERSASGVQQLVRLQIEPSSIFLDIDANSMLLAASNDLQQRLHLKGYLVSETVALGPPQTRSTYSASYMPSRSEQDELVIALTLQANRQQALARTVRTLDLIHSINAAGVLPIKLDSARPKVPAEYSLEVKLPTGKSLISPQYSASDLQPGLTLWLDKQVPAVSRALDCQPLALTTRELNDGSLRLAAGSVQGVVKGQRLLLLDQSGHLSYGLDDMSQAHFGLYEVASLGRNHARLELMPGSAKTSNPGPKIVIPF